MSHEDIIYPTGTTCEITPLRPTKDNSMPDHTFTTPKFYACMRAAKTKAEGGACYRKYISAGAPGGFNNIPTDVWEKQEKWFPLSGLPDGF